MSGVNIMAKIKRKAYDKLDRRIKDWNATVSSKTIRNNPRAYRKPGSMKRSKG